MLRTGEGKQATASATTARWAPTNAGANGISVSVIGTASVFVLVNCTVEEFNAAYVAQKCIRVAQGMPYNFNGDKLQNISSICYRTESGESAVDFAAF